MVAKHFRGFESSRFGNGPRLPREVANILSSGERLGRCIWTHFLSLADSKGPWVGAILEISLSGPALMGLVGLLFGDEALEVNGPACQEGLLFE